jgi:hypothetical protein
MYRVFEMKWTVNPMPLCFEGFADSLIGFEMKTSVKTDRDSTEVGSRIFHSVEYILGMQYKCMSRHFRTFDM